MDANELYWKIDEEDISDEEKRDIYFNELSEQNDYEEWCDSF